MNADFSVKNEGSIFILYALTEAANLWVAANLPEDVQTWGPNGFVVEHRYIEAIVNGILTDGLEVR